MNALTKVAFLTALVMLVQCPQTHGRSGELDGPTVALSTYLRAADREKILDTLSRKDCTFVSGSYLNKDTQIHYKSDTDALGKFLGDLSKCPDISLQIGFYKPGPNAMWAVENS